MAFDTYTLRMLLKEHGVDVTLRKVAESSYNNDTGTISTTNTDYTVRAYFYDYNSDTLMPDSIQNGERRVVVSGVLTNGSTTPKPDVTDQIINGDILDVVKVFDVKSGSNTLFYTLTVRD